VAANAKLRDRSAAIVADVVGCPVGTAYEALAACEWNARAAVLNLVADLAPAAAVQRAVTDRSLRETLVALEA
jgi:N-acetylmuramic acid 6-phosphate etherase